MEEPPAEGRQEAHEVGSTKGEATSEADAPTPSEEAAGIPAAKARPKKRLTKKQPAQRVVHMLPPTPSSAGAAGEPGGAVPVPALGDGPSTDGPEAGVEEAATE